MCTDWVYGLVNFFRRHTLFQKAWLAGRFVFVLKVFMF